jgi:transposase InsO family protein
VTPRTVHNWKRAEAPGATPARPPGRPKTAPEVHARAREIVRAVLVERATHDLGEAALRKAHPTIPIRALREALKVEKAARAERAAKHAEEARVSTTVHAVGAVWVLDGTHTGREPQGPEVAAEVARDVASGLFLPMKVGKKAGAIEIVWFLEMLRRLVGAVPLVLVTDNGSAYRSILFAAYLWIHGVIHLRSLPRTPQHNPFAERGIRTVKLRAGVGKGYVVLDQDELRRRLEQVRCELNTTLRQRPQCLLTPAQCWGTMPMATTLVARKTFFDAACANIVAAQRDNQNTRDRRKAVREAIAVTLEQFNLITRTRGGRPITPRVSEIIT